MLPVSTLTGHLTLMQWALPHCGLLFHRARIPPWVLLWPGTHLACRIKIWNMLISNHRSPAVMYAILGSSRRGPTNSDTLTLRIVGCPKVSCDTVAEISSVWSVETNYDTVAYALDHSPRGNVQIGEGRVGEERSRMLDTSTLTLCQHWP